jgi:hypothetical protein
VDWFNNRRLLEPIGNIPNEAEDARMKITVQIRRLEGTDTPAAAGAGSVEGGSATEISVS